jgi:hypothetical protein
MILQPSISFLTANIHVAFKPALLLQPFCLAGNTPYNARLDIPALNLNDGPQGFRSNQYPGTT